MLIWKSLSLHACTKYKEEETLHFTFPQVKMVSDSGLRNRSFFTRWGGGGLWNFLNPHYELPWPPPHSVLIFSHAPHPPTDGHLLGVTPISKETLS